MGPTGKFVGPANCIQTQVVARPAPRNLACQLVGGSACTPSISVATAWRRGAKRGVTLGLLLLFAETGHPQLGGPVDPYTSEFEKSPQVDYYHQAKFQQAATARQEQFRKRVSVRHAVGDDVPLAFSRRDGNNPNSSRLESDEPDLVRQGILLLVASGLTAILVGRMLAPRLFKAVVKRLNPWAFYERAAPDLAAKIRAEDEAFGEFLVHFQAGPTTAGPASPDASPSSDAGRSKPEVSAQIGRLLENQRTLLQQISGATEDWVRRPMLADLGRDLQTFKGEVSAPGFLPAWQLTSALEGLLKQLSDKSANVTPSTLRTVGGALDLMGELCQPGSAKNILSDPPLKFLAVDDDMISRIAVSLALKKAFNQPDLAENGEAALQMATRQAYDVIFLDVQMQGMDGFELCSQIHQTEANRATPVVFVTCMSDFDARAQSILSGGSELMGKPFLTFEITVKALTLALSRRLHAPRSLVSVPVTSSYLEPQALSVPQTVSRPAALGDQAELSRDKISDQNFATTEVSREFSQRDASLDVLESAFLTRASVHLEALRERVRQLSEATDENTRQDTLADLYLWLHALTPGLDSTTSHPAMRVSAALEGLLKKLLEDPQNWTSSALLTITNAMDLLDDLCGSDVNIDRLTGKPMHILVVDDDLVSRRAMVCALQMLFEKPQSAENGNAAVTLASETTFDLIFLDVQMPGMDGFTTCAKIRETAANRTTPLVFVTGQTDYKTRVQAATSGGNGLFAKPFLVAEISVKALTFVFRGRLENNFPQNAAMNGANIFAADLGVVSS